MILTDAGPLIALLNRNDPNHRKCSQAMQRLPRQPLLTTWPCFTEAMYFMQRIGGYKAQEALWNMRTTGRLKLYHLQEDEIAQMVLLMAKYQNVPMDLADASLMVVAESQGYRRVFTLDADFQIYRLADGTSLQTVP